MVGVGDDRNGSDLQRFLFDLLYRRSLLYNACWEDPALDREAMVLGPEDEVLVITSAGCNALDYALEGPRRVWAIDANPRQSALLALKLAGIRALDHDDFFAFFGRGFHPQARTVYASALRPLLDQESRRFWDRHCAWFAQRDPLRRFYYQGLSGKVARWMVRYLRSRPRLWHGVETLLEARNQDEQRAAYCDLVEPYLFTRGFSWLLQRQAMMSMLGVPDTQRRAVAADHEGGVAGFIRSAFEAVFANLPLHDNYFWMVYLRGGYTPTCCPRYLEAGHFQRLKHGLVDRIEHRTATVTDFLAGHRRAISHFVLLDHMDWMGRALPQALSEEWQWILSRCTDDARILFRSGSREPTFLRDCRVAHRGRLLPIADHLDFRSEQAEALHARDRVHTYASFHIASPRVA
jgi:S-adenosylmethionine-diacylglycerol 3-amino-3-carboxypropyl transferase